MKNNQLNDEVLNDINGGAPVCPIPPLLGGSDDKCDLGNKRVGDRIEYSKPDAPAGAY